jgi:hypothetical protein
MFQNLRNFLLQIQCSFEKIAKIGECLALYLYMVQVGRQKYIRLLKINIFIAK